MIIKLELLFIHLKARLIWKKEQKLVKMLFHQATGTKSVTFTNSFYPNPNITVISTRTYQTGDYYQITSKSKTGFTIVFYNSSNTRNK